MSINTISSLAASSNGSAQQMPTRYLGFIASADAVGCRRKCPKPWGQVKPQHCDSCGERITSWRGVAVCSYEPDGPHSRMTFKVCGACAPQLPTNLELLARLQAALTFRCPRQMLGILARQISAELGEVSA